MAEAAENLLIKISADVAQAIKGMDRLTDSIEKLTKSMDGATSSTKKANSATKQNTEETKKNEKEHKKAGNSAKHHASGLTRLAAALKRILIYRAIRGMIKATTTAMGEGIKRMYEWSEANDQVFMRVMDTYATEVQYLKDALGAAIAPLIEMLMPHLVQLVDWFVELINVANQFFRALAGYDNWLKVDKVATKFADDASKAAKAQKALNTQLMDFDQLNLITTPKSSGKKEEETSPLTGAYTAIDPAIKEAAERFRKFLEPFKELKGILSEIWDEMSPIIAPFVEGVFEEAGYAISIIKDALVKLKENGVFKLLSDIIGGINKSTLDLVHTVLQVFEKVLDKLSKSQAFKGLIEAIGKFTKSGIDQTISVIKTFVESGALDDIIDGLEGFFSGLTVVINSTDEFAEMLTKLFVAIIPAIGKIAGIVLTAIGKALASVGKILGGIVDMITWIMGSASDGTFWSGAWKVIYNLFLDPLFTLVETILEIGKGVTELLGQDKLHKQFEKWSGDIASFKTEVSTGRIFLSDEAKRLADEAKKSADKTKTSFGDAIKNIEGDIGAALEEMTNGIKDVEKSFKKFSTDGKTWGADFRKNFLGEIKKIEETKVTMQPGQQGAFNLKVTGNLYANGGYPDMGSMFIAGEAGAEMVGTINGRTGVASGQEITGIAEAVYGTGAEEANLLRQLINAVREQRLVISPSASFGKVVNQSQRLYQGVTG